MGIEPPTSCMKAGIRTITPPTHQKFWFAGRNKLYKHTNWNDHYLSNNLFHSFMRLKPIISDNTFPTNKHTIYKLINFNLETVSVNLAWATISRSIYWLLYRWKVQHYLRGLVSQQIYTQNFVPSNEFPWFYLKTYCFYSFTWPELWY